MTVALAVAKPALILPPPLWTPPQDLMPIMRMPRITPARSAMPGGFPRRTSNTGGATVAMYLVAAGGGAADNANGARGGNGGGVRAVLTEVPYGTQLWVEVGVAGADNPNNAGGGPPADAATASARFIFSIAATRSASAAASMTSCSRTLAFSAACSAIAAC